MPNMPEAAEVCNDKPSDEQVEQIRNYCWAYQPASRAHVEFELVREIGLRTGAIRAINEIDCEATNNRQASKCESSFSPHPLRRWSIEYQLDEGISKEILSDRVDGSVPVLDKHYDRRTEERKRRRRLNVLSEHLEGYEGND